MKNILALLLIVAIAAYAGDIKPIPVGETVPMFKLKNYDGKEYSSDTLMSNRKFTVIMFIATECPVSNAYNKRMVKIHETYNKKGIGFIGINSNIEENVQRIAEHAKKNGFPFVVLKDDSNKIADLYGALVTPELYVINNKGKLLYEGRIDDNRNADKVQSKDLEITLDALLAGKEPPRTVARAFGCTIKRISKD